VTNLDPMVVVPGDSEEEVLSLARMRCFSYDPTELGKVMVIFLILYFVILLCLIRIPL
jgi:hypothetical protein